MCPPKLEAKGHYLSYLEGEGHGCAEDVAGPAGKDRSLRCAQSHKGENEAEMGHKRRLMQAL